MKNICTKENFYTLIGQTLEFCQTIEHDLKCIYISFLKEYEKDQIQKLTLGGVLTNLQYLQNEEKLNLFTRDEYHKLFEITNKRNYIAHQCFNDFNYFKNGQYDVAFKLTFDNVNDFNQELCELWQKINKIKKDMLKKGQ